MKYLKDFRKTFWHDLLGWHNCKGGDIEYNGQLKGHCTCGKKVMRSSQDWFSMEPNESLFKILKRLFTGRSYVS